MLIAVLVYNLSLAVSLGVKYNKELNFNPKDTAKFILKIWYKLRTIIRDNWFRGTVKLIDIINIEVGYILYNCGLKMREGDRLLI